MKFYSPALLFTAATLIICTTEGSYESLSILEQDLVDKAITQANNQYKNSRQHMNYASTNGVPRLEPHFTKFNVLLKPTNCTKGDGSSGFTHRQGCNFLRASPYINCIVCKNRPGSDYFIHCIIQDRLSKDVQDHRNRYCFERLHGEAGEFGMVGRPGVAGPAGTRGTLLNTHLWTPQEIPIPQEPRLIPDSKEELA